jgi:hypothetical protein
MSDAELHAAAVSQAQPFTSTQKRIITAFVSEYVAKRIDAEISKLRTENDALRDEVGELRADVTLLRAIMKGDVQQLRGSDAA